ncbi:43073_t:CDS:2 [Gigaspora margarita]|uniref:43073_t:CDS:1 n=1 Tax=Gigaspora margarita TaxID=4874 RepID=A0ABN7TYS8_GIGMA|nr:43073_t:CDS:2 [Gigaspora margarita]
MWIVVVLIMICINGQAIKEKINDNKNSSRVGIGITEDKKKVNDQNKERIQKLVKQVLMK